MRNILFFGSIVMCATMCTPKVTEQTQSPTPKVHSQPAVSANPCATFKDSKAGEAAIDAHVIYRDFVRREDFEQAIPYWREAFAAAPGADGKRTTHFDDGVKIYGYLLAKQSTVEAKKLYLDSIFYLYDRMEECYPEIAHSSGKKAFDLYYYYRDLADNKTIFNYFTKVLDTDGLKTPAFVINPFTALLVEMFTAKEIDQPTAVRYAKLVLAITDKHAATIADAPCDMQLKYVKNNAGECMSEDIEGKIKSSDTRCCELADEFREGWPIVIGYAPAQLDVFETVKGFYDCDYFKDKYFSSINIDSVGCDDIPLIYAQLRRGDCPGENQVFAALEAEYQERCTTTPTRDSALSCAEKALKEERYEDAIICYVDYISRIQDPQKRAKYNLFVAKIYYGQLRNFVKARDHAKLALRDRPNYGEAYMLIGKLYASSGPLCGPGRGWDSQIVTWPAIDMFLKAKQVDPSVSSEANRLITTYNRYMPSNEDIFQRTLSEGASFFVGCWIQETTTIRAAK